MQLPTVPTQGLFKQGYKQYESEDGVVNKNIAAVREIASMIRTSVGPAGRNKIIVNNLQKVFLTSDASTILRELEIVHPAVKLVVMASQQQEAEYGDASNLVVILTGELLNQAEELLRVGMSASEIVNGFSIAKNYAIEALKNQEISGSDVPLEIVLRSVISSRQFGYSDLLESLVADAVRYVMPRTNPGLFNVDNVRVVKILGSSLPASKVVKGMVFPQRPEGLVQQAANARVCMFTSAFDIQHTETKGTVLLNNADELLKFSKGEEKRVDEFVSELKLANISVVVCGAAIGSLAQHYLNKHGILAFRVPSKFDMLRLARVTNSSLLPALRVPDEQEVGVIDSVDVEEIGGDLVTVFKQSERRSRTATIVLRGATQNTLDDVERAIDDGVAAVKSLARGALKASTEPEFAKQKEAHELNEPSARLVPGAGGAEIAIAAEVFAHGERTPGVAQHAVKAYARAFEVVPRTLASNAGLDDSEVVAKMYAYPVNQSLDKQKNPAPGVDVEAESADGVLDAKSQGIYDISVAKESAIELATEAACTVLTVDQIIMAKRAGGPAMPKQGGDWDQD